MTCILELLFPSFCLTCNVPLFGAPNGCFCAACWERVGAADHAACSRCGIRLAADSPRGVAGWQCGACLKHPPRFDLARTLGPYEGVLAEALRQLKYREQTGLAGQLVARLGREKLPAPYFAADRVVPVPLHVNRLRGRGFNQAARLALALGNMLGVPVDDRLLVRTVDTPSQVGLSRARRKRNVARAFAVTRPDAVRGRDLILVDDVMTTGATVNTCARMLKGAGAHTVLVWAVGRQELG